VMFVGIDTVTFVEIDTGHCFVLEGRARHFTAIYSMMSINTDHVHVLYDLRVKNKRILSQCVCMYE